MSKYRKFAVVFILIEILMLIIVNVWAYSTANDNKDKQYKVDISRIENRIKNGEDISNIPLSDYEEIVSVSEYDDQAIYKNEYAVRKIDGIYYCFEYQEGNDKRVVTVLNAMVLCIIFLNCILLLYIDKKVITPFSKMDNLTAELAKGNLSTPIKQEKSKYFGKFLWGMDMLRETLEDNKKRELELLKEKKTLVLSLSHDIKTPLSAIDLYSKALRRNLYETEEERTAAYDGIDTNISEIKKYVKEIANASREDFLALEVHNGELYLVPLLEKIRTYYEEKMNRLRIDFKIDSVDNCMIYGDSDRIIEVMQNTIENAIKYGDGKEISISFDEEENCKLITVSNTGCKLGEEEIPHIFDSFYRGSNSDKAEGSGLGLYICKELMHRMDGEVFANINDNKFNITLVIRKA